MSRTPAPAFTLAELLICMLILGEIATFTIPKVLQSQQNNKYNSIAKEAIGTIAQAYNTLQLQGLVTANTTGKDLTPYMNYVKAYTSGFSIDGSPGNTVGYTMTCSAAEPCIVLHNGAVLMMDSTTLGTATNMHYFPITIDPSGQAEGGNDGLWVEVYYEGRITTWQYRYPNSYKGNAGPVGPCAGCDPSWFSW